MQRKKIDLDVRERVFEELEELSKELSDDNRDSFHPEGAVHEIDSVEVTDTPGEQLS
jgi:hypothetical protein